MQLAKHLLNRTARVLTLSLGLATLVPTVAFSQSDLAKREMMRRSEKVRQAEELLGSGREAYQDGDYQSAVTSYNEALGVLPGGFATAERRRVLEAHLADATVALSQQFRRTGKYAEAREKLNQVLTIDPNNQRARQEIEYLDDPVRTNPALSYDHTTNVDKVRRFLYTAEGFKNLGLFDDAIREYQKALQVDAYNSAARRGMEVIHQLKSDHYRTAFDEARSRMLAEVDAAWEMAVPPPIELDGSVVGGLRPSAVGVNIEFKLKNMIIPVVDFDDTTVEEAIDFLRQRATELDKWELDPVKKGINFVIRKPRIGGGAPDAELDVEGGLGAIDPGSARVKELKLRNVPLSSVLQYICEQARLRFKVDDFAVTLLPIGSAEGEDVLTRKWKVPPTFLNDIGTGGDGDGGADPDPFAGDDEGLGNRSLAPRRPLKEILQDAGIDFPPGSSAQYIPSTSTLIVSNTPQNLDLVDQLVEDILGGSPKMIRIVTKFVEVAQENSDELSFDWIVTPFGLGGVVSEELFAGGGTQGNGQIRTGADFISPVAFTNIPGIPAGSNTAVQNIVTASNRSGDTAVTRNSIDAVLNNPNRSAQVNRPAPGILSLTGLFNDGQLQMIMRGLAQKKGTDIMTAPSVTARPGQKATIEIIREFIYPTEYEPPELPNQVGGGLGNQGGGALGGGGGAGGFPVTPATPTAFETRNTGVTLEIEPNLGPNEYVIDLRFAPEIVEFEGFINYGSPITSPATDAFGNPVTVTITENRIEMPVFSSRRVSTGITIYDGHTVAVGGLMREDVQDVEDGVPILSDIPLIGRLFQSQAQSHIKSNLIIFVTANIIDASGKDYRKPNEVDPSGTPVEPVSTDLGGGPEGILPPL
ncbi:MAG TPA: type II and III secretion system protein [Verrucomicrobiales bacterium]|nr:type II and III secretion system protein [Verrucomicrobiales bacterium]